ncbi:sensor histidine kinase [Agrococcus sp. SGAir0287]|uniref:sensor histidine kinase n=1 Tax=Agrococcus sp. SGAir0287 TaxID=2070347 RepID=UPI0010CD2089|nr:histidine kinase [Agrococcus sp. SGAir0287]QCR19845.1 two-component sensor histidine kinase [Agrococcus sp. SGAir0287]
MDGRRAARLVDAVPVAVSAIVGGLVVATALGGAGGLLVPLSAWAVILAAFLAALASVSIAVERVPEAAVHPLLAVAVAGGIALVVLAPGASWIMIVLVFTALVSAYLGPLWLPVVVVLANCGGVVAASLLQGASPAALALTTGIYVVLQAMAVVFVRIFVRETELRQELELTTVRLRAAQAMLAESSRADERVRIARELHDVLGHQLTVLALDLEAASHLTTGDAREQVVRARDVAKGMLGEVRATVSALRAPRGDLAASLRAIADDVASIDLEVRVADDVAAVAPAQAEAILRGAQELVTNALRHARATHLLLEVRREDGLLVLDAHDDGVGAAVVRPGNGLTGVRERVEALGGTLTIDGGRGFRVTARVPA